jgi:hypothetical protein
MYAHLPSPADEREPFKVTDEQAELILDWYAIDDRGVYIYRRGILERAKGWGKSPLVAGAMALPELAGPVVFDGWDADGEPVGRPRGQGDTPAHIQIAAVSEDQTENTYGAIYGLLTANEARAADELRIDIGRTRLYLMDRPEAGLYPVTASAGSREGQRVTFAVLDETHLWTPTNHGVKLAATIRRNAGKMNGRTIETTNAPVIGGKSVAERSESDVERGFSGILHYAARPAEQPEPDWEDDRLLEALSVSYGDANWIDKQRILKEIRDPATAWDDSLRFYFNIRTVGSGRAVDPRVWDALAKPREVPAGTPVGLGWDGSNNRDASALRACTEDGYSFVLGIWQRPSDAPPDWTVPREEVHRTLDAAFKRYRVGRMFCDPWKWHSEIEEWTAKYGKDGNDDPIVVVLDTNQNSKFVPAVDRWLTAIREGTHTHDGDPMTSDHVKSATLKQVRLADDPDDGRTRYRLEKGEGRRPNDAAVADVLAYEAAMTMTVPKKREPKFRWA